MTAIARQSVREPRTVDVRAALGAVIAVALIAGAIVIAFIARRPDAAQVQSESAELWLSGEAKGRVVLATARGERPALAVELGTEPTEFDVVDIDAQVIVFDRTTSEIIVLDGPTGAEQQRTAIDLSGATGVDLVSAGDTAYLVDDEGATFRVVDSLGIGDPIVVDGGFTNWVGGDDGQLWLVDSRRGTYASFDGRLSERTKFADAGAALELSVVGAEPVVFDASSNRLRWLRRGSATSLGDSPPSGTVAIGRPTAGAECLTVVEPDRVSCISPDGVERSAALDPPIDPAGVMAGSSPETAVLVRSDSTDVVVVEWATGASTNWQRLDPSSRVPRFDLAAGSIVVDDPGSRFAFSVTGADIVALDKFSQRTIVVSGDGGVRTAVAGSSGDTGVDAVVVDDSGPLDPNDGEDDGLNDPPIARNDTVATRVGRTTDVDVLINDIDPDGEPLTITAVGPLDAADGQVSIVQGSSVLFIPPDTKVDRTISFDYEVTDPGGLDDVATVSVDVIASDRNTAPRAFDDEASTPLDTPVTVPVLSNDIDDEGDPLTVTDVDQPDHGSVAVDADGQLQYEPDRGYSGADQVTYRVTDGYGGTATANLLVTVISPADENGRPDAVDDRSSVTAGERQRLAVLDNDVDPDGDQLSIVAVGSVPGLDITIVDAQTIDIVASDDATGTTTFDYTISDEGGLTDTARVTVVVAPSSAAGPPQAIDDNATSASIPILIDVVTNDLDPAGGQLVVTAVAPPPSTEATVVQVSARAVQFTPRSGFIGTVRFRYTVSNASGQTASAAVNVVVTTGSGSTPIARDDRVTIFPGEVAVIPALANDLHPDGLPFDFAGLPTARAGTVSIRDRSIVFTPPNADLTTYTLSYTIQDSFKARSSATVLVTVAARPVTNGPPIAANDLQTTPFGTSVTIDVLANDTDPDGDALRLVSAGPASVGTVEISGNRVRVVPPDRFAGILTFPYTVADPEGASAQGTVTVQVAERIRVAPVTTPDLLNVITGSSATVDPTANDLDPDGGTARPTLLSIGSASPSGLFTATIVSNGVRIVAGAAAGSGSLTYTVVDADGLTANGVLSVAVLPPPNNPPTAAADSVNTLAIPTLVPVLNNDSDPDGGVLTLAAVTAVSPTGAGTATVVGNQVSFAPAASFTGTATFGYTVRDPQGATDTATVSVTVAACPAVPVLTAINTTTRFATPVVVPLFGGAPLPPGGATVSLGAVSAGSASLSTSNTSITYTPPPTFNGVATIAYSVRTTCGAVAGSSISVTVNRAPVAADDTATTNKNTAVVVPVLANDLDPDGDTLTVASVGAAAGGQVSLLAGVVTFTPTTGFAGTGTFSYVVRDVGGLTSSGDVSVVVANQAPVAVADSLTTFTSSGPTAVSVIANDTDPNGDTLTLVSIGTITPSGSFTAVRSGNTIQVTAGATPATGSITYVVSDGALTSTGTLTVQIQNRPPVANPDATTLDLAGGNSVTSDVRANDNDPDGPLSGVAVTAASVTSPSGAGTVTFTSTSVQFTAASSLAGGATVVITYTITDSRGGTATSTLTITVTDSTPPTDPPVTP